MAAVVSKELMHGSRRQTLVQQVLLKFFQGEYQPNQRMTVQALAREWNVSATPVREALVELEGIGIGTLDHGPRKVLIIVRHGKRTTCGSSALGGFASSRAGRRCMARGCGWPRADGIGRPEDGIAG